MFINNVLSKCQTFTKPFYDKSFFLKNIDWLILLNILAVIFSSTFAQSDTIGNFAIFAMILTFIKLITKTGEKFELTLGDKCLLVYFIIVLISLAGSSLFYFSLKGFCKTFVYIGFYIALIHYLKNNKDKIHYLILAIILSVFYESIIAFIQNFSAVDEISGWQDTTRLNPEEVMTRVYGTLKPYNPNLFGGYMLACIPAFLGLPFFNNTVLTKKITLILSIIGGLLAIIAIFLTGCRGAYIGLFFEILTLIIITYKFLKSDFKNLFSMIICFGVCITSFIIVSISALRARIFSIFAMRSDSSNSFRFNVYHSCIEMLKDNWILGIGCGNQNFREIYGLYMKTGFDALSAYNIYLEIAVESGIFALITFLGFLIINLVNCIKKIIGAKAFTDIVFILIALISIVGMLIHGCVDTVFFRPQIQFIFWIMIGIIRTLV